MRCSSCRVVLVVAFVAACPLFAFPAGATMPPPTGPLPREISEAFEKGLFDLPPPPTGLGVSAGPMAVWHLPIILAAFSDEDLTFAAADFDSALFGTRSANPTGSVRDYYRWASGGRLDVTGRVVAAVHLPGTMAFYGDGLWGLSGRRGSSAYGALDDALYLCQNDVDWSEFDLDHDGKVDMIWLVHAGKGGEASANELPAKNRLWSFTSALSKDPSGGSVFQTSQLLPGSLTQHFGVDRFSCLPELSGLIPTNRSEVGVYCHEFGHALGLPDLYDRTTLGTVANSGPGNWSLMSTGAYGGNGIEPYSPAHLGGWASAFLGWTQQIRPTQDTTIDLAPLTSGGPVIEFWFQGESNPEHFLLENRTRTGYDTSLVKPGMIITHVDDALIAQRLAGNLVNTGSQPGLLLVEGDGNNDLFNGVNRGDPFDPFPGDSLRTLFDDVTRPNTHTFKDAVTNISLSNISQVGHNIHMSIQVRAPGWLPPEDHTDPSYQPYPSSSFGNLSVMAPDGSADVVDCEIQAGHPQIVIHSRIGGVWTPGIVLSTSSGAALAPAIAGLPGGNAVVVWSDTRAGRSQIWGRVRLQGSWGPERMVCDVPGDNVSPAIGADSHGRVYLTWLNLQNSLPRVYFSRFVYFAPFGQSIPVSSTGRQPDSPAIAVDGDGISYIMWPDLADNPRKFWFARFQPDTGLSAPQYLTATAGSETGMSALVDSSGTVHLVWLVTGTGVSEIHYQRRFKSARPSPRDTVLVSNGNAVANPRLAIEPSGSLHVVYENTVAGGPQIYYKRWRPGLGWDFQGTAVTSPTDGTASTPLVLPETPGNLSVVYTAYQDVGTRFMVRRRQLDSQPPETPRLAAVVPAGGIALRPNPLRAGQEFELDGTGAAPISGATAEIFDLAGRRVAATLIERRGATWSARFSGAATARLTSGVYFVRTRAAGSAAQRLVVLR